MESSLFSLSNSFSEKCWERCFKVPNISCDRSNWDRFLSIVSHLEAWRSIIWRRWFPLYLSDFALVTSWELAESTNLTGGFLISVGAVWLERWILLMKVKWWRFHFLGWQLFISNWSNNIAWVIESTMIKLLTTFLLPCIWIEWMLLQL